MDILILNIGNLSKECNECLRTYIAMNDGGENLIGSLRVDCKAGSVDCPLVALPDHGRLGDLDALKNSVADMRMEKLLRNGAKQVIEIGELFGRIIDDAPTVVEATNGTDN